MSIFLSDLQIMPKFPGRDGVCDLSALSALSAEKIVGSELF